GMRVIVRGRISLYERDGAFQIYVDAMFPDGIGAMQLAFDQLKEKLEKEGLFDTAHKRMLPEIPHCVGLVTSKTGAALQDIFNVTKRRYPMAHFLLCPVTVQGNESAQGIAAAIRTLDESGLCDVMIVARGGGSREDLWVFNSELIARAAYACKTPLVSAIGHEIDFCILDFVADLRAPTPSAAAEPIMPEMQSAAENICKIFINICKEIQKKLDLCYNEIVECETSAALTRASLLPQRCFANLHSVQTALEQHMQARLARLEQTQQHHAALCASLNPYGVLSRGYCIARKAGTVLKDSREVQVDDTIEVQLLRGRLHCVATETESGEL
ncbi:MAG: exodeoxyribonuclease VII large subunit, partial [Ruthenibacterium sp.]